MSGSYALAVRRRARHGQDVERDDLSEASPCDPGSPGRASESALVSSYSRWGSVRDDSSEGEPAQANRRARVTTHRRASLTSLFYRSEAPLSNPASPGRASESLPTSCHESSDGELDDSSEGEPDETYQKASVRGRRRATCFRNRRASMSSQSEGELPRLLGGVVAAPKSPGKTSEPPLASCHDSREGGRDDSFGSSEGELDETGATTLRRASLATQRRLASRSS